MALLKIPLYPVITIKKDDGTLYTFNPFDGTYDFKVASLRTKPVSDSKGGVFTLRIQSSDASNSGANTLLSNITGANEVTIWVGKSDLTKTKIFLGIVETIKDIESTPELMDITLSGPDWGSNILKNRIIDQDWIQDKQSDGITLDNTDDTVLISQIVEDLLTQNSSYFVENDVTIEDQGVIVSSANITPNDLRIAQFSARMETADDKLDELDEYGNAIHYIDAEKIFYMKEVPLFTSSTPTFMISDNETDAAVVAWDQDKLGLIQPGATIKNSLEHYKRRLYGVGGDQLKLDVEKAIVTHSTPLYDKYIAVQFTTKASNLDSLAISLSKTGTPSIDPILEIIEDDGGAPGSNVISIKSINRNAITTSAQFHVFTMNLELVANTTYWMILRKDAGDVSNTINWHRDNADTGIHSTSTDGITFTPATTPDRHNYACRVYSRNPITPFKPGTGITATDLLREEVLRDSAITDYFAMNAKLSEQLTTASQLKQILTCKIYAPNDMFAVGDKISVNKTASGKVIVGDFLISNMELIFDSSNQNTPGPTGFDIECVRFIPFSI